MNLDYASIPSEIWCDLLEDGGITTEEIRALFESIPFYNGKRENLADGHGVSFSSGYGDGCTALYQSANWFGNGDLGRYIESERGSGVLHDTGDGAYYGYDPNRW